MKENILLAPQNVSPWRAERNASNVEEEKVHHIQGTEYIEGTFITSNKPETSYSQLLFW